MRRLGAAVVVAVLGCLVVPAFTQADGERCAEIEAALRDSAQEYGWSEAKIEEYAHDGAAACWEEVREFERYEAETEAEIKHAQEEEAAKEAERKARRQQEIREQHQVRREEWRRKGREERRHRREWHHKPAVTLEIAQHLAKGRLNKEGFSNGWVDCKGGRINRTRWACRVSLFYRCERSRMQVWGAGYRDGRPYYGTRAGHFHPCRLGREARWH